MSLKTALAFAAAALIAAPPAFAEDPGEVVSVRVKTADLNLNTDKGVQVLMRRLTSAGERICGPTPGIAELANLKTFKACMDAALSPAVASVGNERLTALYAARTHRSATALAANP